MEMFFLITIRLIYIIINRKLPRPPPLLCLQRYIMVLLDHLNILYILVRIKFGVVLFVLLVLATPKTALRVYSVASRILNT